MYLQDLVLLHHVGGKELILTTITYSTIMT